MRRAHLRIPTMAVVAAVMLGACAPQQENLADQITPGGAAPLPTERDQVAGAASATGIDGEAGGWDEATVKIVALEGNESTIPVRAAADPAALLAGTTTIPLGTGVLATYTEARSGSVDVATDVAVDLLFIGANRSVLTQVACESCGSADPGTPYVAVLALPGGWAAQNGISGTLRVLLPEDLAAQG